MSDNVRVNPEEILVTASQFQAFLAAVAPEKPCPECNVLDWELYRVSNDERDDPILQAGVVRALNDEDKIFPVHTMSCRNCGYIKLYSARRVAEWVADHG